MDQIERLDHGGFTDYLRKCCNTICGRHAIGIFLGALNILRAKNDMNVKCK